MNKKLLPIIFLTFVNILGFAILIPILPFIIERYGGNSITYGILLSAYPIFQFFGAPVLGTLSDKYGRRPLLLASVAGTAVGWAVFALAFFVPDISIAGLSLPLVVLFLARMIDGITGGNNSIAMAYASDVTAPKDKTKVFGMLGAVFGIGLMLGPAIGGATSAGSWGYVGTAAFAFALTLVTLLLLFLFLPESLHHSVRNTNLTIRIAHEINIFYKMKKYRHNTGVLQLFALKASFLFVFTAYTSIIVLFIKDRFLLSAGTVGAIFLVIGLFLIFNQAVVARVFAHRFGDFRAFLSGFIIFIIGLPLMIFVPTIPLFLAVAYIGNVGISVIMPTSRSLLTNSVEKHQQGEITGIDESIQAATSAVSPLFAGFLYAHIGGYSFGVFSFLLACALALFVFRYHVKKLKRKIAG